MLIPWSDAPKWIPNGWVRIFRPFVWVFLCGWSSRMMELSVLPRRLDPAGPYTRSLLWSRGVEPARQHAELHHPGRPATEKYPHKWTKYSNSSIWDPFGSITSRNKHPTLPLTEKLSLERLNRMAYSRSEPPYSPGTHLKHRGREEATPAGGTACSFPPAGVAEQAEQQRPARSAIEKYPTYMDEIFEPFLSDTTPSPPKLVH